MDAESFERSVKRYDIPGDVVKKYFGKSDDGRRFALIVNQVVWFKIRLFYEADIRSGGINMQELSQHLTFSAAEQKLDEYRYRFQRNIPVHADVKTIFDFFM